MDGRTARCAALWIFLSALALPGVTAASPVVRESVCMGRLATIVGTSGRDRIEGTDGRDVIAARGGDDVVVADDGPDLVCGGAGDDRLEGRYGNDSVDGGRGADEVRGGPGADLLVGGGGRDALYGGGDGPRGDTLVGGRGSDSLLGGDGGQDSDHLFGGYGNDYLDGGLGGLDRLYPGAGNDFGGAGAVSFEFSPAGVVADMEAQEGTTRADGEGRDTFGEVEGLVGSHHADVLEGDEAGQVVRGLGGDDTIVALGGPDHVDGGPGSDDLDGGDGIDVVSFEDSPDGVTASLRDGVATGAGSDSLSGFESVVGSFFDDHLTGDDRANGLLGSYGHNVVFGLDGDDVLEFADEGDAGAGVDECIWTGQLPGCEATGHFDPPSLPFVSSPVQGADVLRLETVRGGIAGGLGGPREKSVLVSIRRMTAEGCWWWDPDKAWTRGPCDVALGIDAPIREGGWSLRVGADLQAGTYQVRANWHDARYHAGDPCGGAFAPMCVELFVR